MGPWTTPQTPRPTSRYTLIGGDVSATANFLYASIPENPSRRSKKDLIEAKRQVAATCGLKKVLCIMKVAKLAGFLGGIPKPQKLLRIKKRYCFVIENSACWSSLLRHFQKKLNFQKRQGQIKISRKTPNGLATFRKHGGSVFLERACFSWQRRWYPFFLSNPFGPFCPFFSRKWTLHP